MYRTLSHCKPCIVH